MRITTVVLAALLTGCSTITSWIPSFWDPNQSAYIIDARLHAEQISCDQPQLPQVLRVQEDLQRFQLYSASKGSLQQDVIRVVAPIKIQVDEWVQRGEGSRGYCSVKRRLLIQETQRASEVILGRY